MILAILKQELRSALQKLRDRVRERISESASESRRERRDSLLSEQHEPVSSTPIDSKGNVRNGQ